jgi:signal transduction histidine kinase
MVKNIVEQSGGGVAFESVPGEGTVFTVRLPLTDESA